MGKGGNGSFLGLFRPETKRQERYRGIVERCQIEYTMNSLSLTNDVSKLRSGILEWQLRSLLQLNNYFRKGRDKNYCLLLKIGQAFRYHLTEYVVKATHAIHI